MQRRFIRMSELASAQGRPGRWPVSDGTIWRWVATGVLPPPVQLGPQVRAWPLEVIEAYEAQQMAATPASTAQKAAAGRSSQAKRLGRVGVTEA